MAVVVSREVEIPGALTSATGLDDRTPGAVAAARDADIAAAAATAGSAGEVSSMPRIGSGSAARPDARHRGSVCRSPSDSLVRDSPYPFQSQDALLLRERQATPIPPRSSESPHSHLGGGNGGPARWTPSPIPDVTDDILGDVLQVCCDARVAPADCT